MIDDYAREAGFYFSPYGDIGLTGYANNESSKKEKEIQSKAASNADNRDIFDLNRMSDIENEINNITMELNQAGTLANIGGQELNKIQAGTSESNQEKHTLNYMINKGLVKGLPEGTAPEIGLEEQGISLPIRNNYAKPGGKNVRFNPMVNQRAIPGRDFLGNRLQTALRNGKTKSVNNYQKFPNTPPNGYYWPRNGFHRNQRVTPMPPPPPPLIDINLLNSFGIDPVALRQLNKLNHNGGILAYLRAVSTNFESKYDLNLQKEIAEIQGKCILTTPNGDFTPISCDGPGLELDFSPQGTNITSHSRFTSI